MNQIKLIHQRLAGARGLPAVLAAGWDIFELIAAIASGSAGDSADMYPAFTFARGAAVSGRNAIAVAPCLPPLSGNAAHHPPEAAADPYEIADAIAGLAAALCMRLRQEAERAADPADRSACQNAAGEAERIWRLLAEGN